MADFRKLRVFHAAHALAVEVDRVTVSMRTSRTKALCDQLSRAAMSVPANIVEGSAHTSDREFARFLQYALASASETEGHIQMARDTAILQYADFQALMSRVVSVRRQLHSLIKQVRRRIEN